jgi:hypothetical protein
VAQVKYTVANSRYGRACCWTPAKFNTSISVGSHYFYATTGQNTNQQSYKAIGGQGFGGTVNHKGGDGGDEGASAGDYDGDGLDGCSSVTYDSNGNSQGCDQASNAWQGRCKAGLKAGAGPGNSKLGLRIAHGSQSMATYHSHGYTMLNDANEWYWGASAAGAPNGCYSYAQSQQRSGGAKGVIVIEAMCE